MLFFLDLGKQEITIKKQIYFCHSFALQFKILYEWPLLQAETFLGYPFGASFNFRTMFSTISDTEA